MGGEVWAQDLARSLCYLLGQSNLLSQYLSLPRSKTFTSIVREA